MRENHAGDVAFPVLANSKSLYYVSNQGKTQLVSSKLCSDRASTCRASSFGTVESTSSPGASSALARRQKFSCIFNFSFQKDNAAKELLRLNHKNWNQNPDLFWKLVPSCDIEHQIIVNCLKLGTETHDRILRRFFCVLLHRIRNGQRKLRGAKAFAKTYGSSHVQEKEGSIALILQAGARYERIAAHLGTGGLFLLGQKIACSVWERKLPASGEDHREAMCHMVQAGVGELGRKYNRLADKLIGHHSWATVAIRDTRLPSHPSREAAFKWLKDTFPELANTLTLLCFATPDSHVPMEMVTGLEEPPKHWNCEGEEEPGLKTGILEKAGSSIEPLINLNFIESVPEKDGWAICLDIRKYVKLSVEDPVQLSLDALSLVCHIFPKHPKLDPQFGHKGRSLLPSLQHVLGTYRSLKTSSLHPDIGHQLATALLSASFFLDKKWKQDSINYAHSIIAHQDTNDLESLYLQRWASQRALFISRKSCDVDHILGKKFTPTDQRSNAQLGQIVLLAVQSLLERNELTKALLELKWEQFAVKVSRLEKDLLRKRDLFIARVHHLKGDFLVAECRLRQLHERMVAALGLDCLIASRLADITCELDKPKEAESIIMPMLECLTKLKQDWWPRATHLKIALADAYLHQGKYEKAEVIYRDLEHSYVTMTDLSGIAEGDVIRVLFGLARLFHLGCRWDQALLYWEKALAKALDFGWKGGFPEHLIYLSLHHLYLKLDNPERAAEYMERANSLGRVHPTHWCPRLATHWLKYVKEEPQTIILNDNIEGHRE